MELEGQTMKEPADFKKTYVALVKAEREELAAFERAARGAQPADFETAASWRALRPRLEPRRWQLPPALAALLLVAVAGSSGWYLGRQGPSAGLSEPRPNARVVDLFGEASRRTPDGRPQVVAVADAGVLLVLTPAVVPEAPSYKARILDAGGEQVRMVPGLAPHPADQTFTLFLPPGALPDGVYRIELFAGGSAEPIAAYRVRWMRASSP